METIFIALASFFLFHDRPILLLATATLGFLFWNWPKAKIFMGDVGSTFIGFTFAVFAIYYQNNGSVSLLSWLILTSVFWFDATVTLVRRYRNKENLSMAHRKHAYQRIVQAGWSHLRTVLAALLLNLIGFILVWLGISFPKFILAFFIFDILILTSVLRLIDRIKKFE
jgi:UDP-N-acetylmuramyl pentapeptide phosphotransferase/UDP-N-acetylglucosamine-1-phosphate transferase